MEKEESLSKKCPKCESTNIIDGTLSAAYGFTFMPKEQKKVMKKSSYITCFACKSCGYVFDLYLTDSPSKITDR